MSDTENIPQEQLQPLARLALEPVSERQAVTAAQAKVDAVANLTMKAYERAATLQITQEESAALQADFPDDAFKPGAAGKEHLIYLEHAFLRDRLNQVFGLGQWAIIPRNRWAEDFSFINKYNKEVQASRVYVEAMLVVRGCFVAEAVGDMVYYKNNEGQNYGDAVEGAKTAALRRCAKEFGVGLQAWKKDWCEGWWKRRNAPKRSEGVPSTVPSPKNAPQSHPEPTKGTSAANPTEPYVGGDRPKLRMATLHKLLAAPGEPQREMVRQFAMSKGYITVEQTLENWPVFCLPKNKEDMDKLYAEVQAFEMQMRQQDLQEEVVEP